MTHYITTPAGQTASRTQLAALAFRAVNRTASVPILLDLLDRHEPAPITLAQMEGSE